MSVLIAPGDFLPSGKSVTVDIKFAVNLSAPAGIAIRDITPSGFRVDIDETPANTTVIFELSSDNGASWVIVKNGTEDFAVLSGLLASKLYRVRAHYVSGGKHSQYANASATTLGA